MLRCVRDDVLCVVCSCIKVTRQVMSALISKAMLALDEEEPIFKNAPPSDRDDADAAAAVATASCSGSGDEQIMHAMALSIRNSPSTAFLCVMHAASHVT